MSDYSFMKCGSKNESRDYTEIEYKMLGESMQIIKQNASNIISKIIDDNKLTEKYAYLVKTKEDDIQEMKCILDEKEHNKMDIPYIVPKFIMQKALKLAAMTFSKMNSVTTNKNVDIYILESIIEEYELSFIGIFDKSTSEEATFDIFEEDLIHCKCPQCNIMNSDVDHLRNNWIPSIPLENMIKKTIVLYFDMYYQDYNY